MPRHLKDCYEAVEYVTHRLPAVKARIEADIERARARRDLAREYRYAGRLYLVENRFWTTVPCEVSTYSDIR